MVRVYSGKPLGSKGRCWCIQVGRGRELQGLLRDPSQAACGAGEREAQARAAGLYLVPLGKACWPRLR